MGQDCRLLQLMPMGRTFWAWPARDPSWQPSKCQPGALLGMQRLARLCGRSSNRQGCCTAVDLLGLQLGKLALLTQARPTQTWQLHFICSHRRHNITGQIAAATLPSPCKALGHSNWSVAVLARLYSLQECPFDQSHVQALSLRCDDGFCPVTQLRLAFPVYL